MSKARGKSENLQILLICLGLVLATAIAFEPVRHNDFVSYDDAMYVTENPRANEGVSLKSLRWAFTTTHTSNWHPLTWLSHMLDCELFGLNPLWHHLVNLLFHTANTLLLFWVLARLTGAVGASGFVAAAFALHPLHVESVAWVAERKDVLSALFWMLTIVAYIRYTERASIWRFSLVFLAFGVGLTAKPMLVTLPFVLLLLDYWPLRRLQKSTAHRLICEKIPLFVLTTVSSIVTYLAQETTGATEMVENLALTTRINNALVCYVGYIGKMIYPSGLAVLYPHPGASLPAWRPIVSIVALVLITAGIIYLAGRSRRYLAVGWLWYLGTLVPVIGLVQVGRQCMADRYTYLPSVGLFIIGAWGAAELLAKWRYRKVMLSTSVLLVLAALLVCTRIQVRHWRNNFTLCERALSVTENNPVMHYSLGNAFRSENKLDEAITQYRRALRIEPEHSRTHGNLANALLLKGRLEEATEHYRQAVQLDPHYVNARYNLGLALSKQGNFTEAITHYRRVLALEPDNTAALNGIAWILCTHPDKKHRDPGRAIALAKRAAELTEYNKAEILDTLATGYAEAGQFDKAMGISRSALKLALDEQNDELVTRLRQQLQLYSQNKLSPEPHQ
ncbi:MAG: tetratricopeptide repeat protein [Planctomycetota bacterium]|nr:MAG: tetratricopeptide repeat protein [Planctomycetota bacterium]